VEDECSGGYVGTRRGEGAGARILRDVENARDSGPENPQALGICGIRAICGPLDQWTNPLNWTQQPAPASNLSFPANPRNLCICQHLNRWPQMAQNKPPPPTPAVDLRPQDRINEIHRIPTSCRHGFEPGGIAGHGHAPAAIVRTRSILRTLVILSGRNLSFARPVRCAASILINRRQSVAFLRERSVDPRRPD
jgi:hypothetical protein